MKTINQHKLAFQARQVNGIGKTKLVPFNEFFLPLNTCLHYQTESAKDPGMKGNNPLLHNWGENEDVFLSHIEEGYGSKGKPKERHVSRTVIDSHFKANLRFTRARRLDRIIQKPRNMVVLDYTLLGHKHHYTQSLKQNYYEFFNIANAYLEQLKKYEGKREHFIVINMPDHLPDFSDLRKVDEEEPHNDELKLFTNVPQFWLRELWLLIYGEGIFSEIGSLEHVNLLLCDNGKVMSVNLGLFKELTENETKAKQTLIELLDSVGSSRTPVENEELPELSETEMVSGVQAKRVKEFVPELEVTLNEFVSQGALTKKEAARIAKLAEDSFDLPSPIGDGKISDIIPVSDEEIKVDGSIGSLANPKVASEYMKRSRTTKHTREYIEKSLEKDVVRSLVGLSQMGLVLKKIEKTETLDAANDFVTFKVTFINANGKQSTSTIPIPRVDENGMFIANNVKYTQIANKNDVPIRKTGPKTVGLTSYASKVFVMRSERAVYDRSGWVAKKLVKMGLDAEDDRVTNARLGTTPVPDEKLPNDYTSVMLVLPYFKSSGFEYSFEYNKLNETFGEDTVKKCAKLKVIPVAKSKKRLYAMGHDNVVYELVGDSLEPLGALKDVIGGEWGREPIDTHFIGIYGKEVPLGLALGRFVGLKKLLKDLKIKHRIVPSNVRTPEEQNEVKLTFKDQVILFDRYDKIASPVMAGFLTLKENLKRYNLHEFESPEVYTACLMSLGLSPIVVKELTILRQGFVDPKTREILVQMKEPTDFVGLLYRSAELLKDDRAPKETDPKFMRLRGYERIGGFIYREYMDSIRNQRNLPNPSLGTVSISPSAVWQFMVGDATTQLVETANPNHRIKEQSAVSLTGWGGRSPLSLVGRTRVFHKDDLGIFSESVPDSSKVGIRTYLTADAAINNTLGMFGSYDPATGATGAFSTTSNIMPAANHDDKQLK